MTDQELARPAPWKYLYRCSSPNHPANERRAQSPDAMTSCEACGRWYCILCEGGEDTEECDTCWCEGAEP